MLNLFSVRHYIGIGAKGKKGCCSFNRRVIEGDIWKYDTVEDEWELIGWIPFVTSTTDTNVFPIEDAIEIDGKNYFIMFSSNNGTNVVTITTDEISSI